MREESRNSNNLTEVLQSYFPDEGNFEFRFSAPLKEEIIRKFSNLESWDSLKAINQLFRNLISDFGSYFGNTVEEVFSRPLYFAKDVVIKDNLLDISPALRNLANKLIFLGFIKELQYGLFFNDEPKMFRFSTQYGDYLKNYSDSGGVPGGGGASGSSFTSRDEALMRCLAEGIERTCGGFYKNKDLVRGSYRELKNSGLDLINPLDFVSFSERQYKENPRLATRRVSEDSFLKWTWGKSLITGRKILVPAQTVYVPYSYDKDEAFMRSNITTGAAVYTEENESIYRGLCEATERDAFIIYYLNKVRLPEVNLEKSFDGRLKPILKILKRYNLEIHTLDSTTDVSIPTFFTLLIDRTGLGPALTTGNRADLDIEKAIFDSIVEALKSRPWALRAMREKELIEKFEKLDDSITSLQHRAFYWSHLERLKDIEFYLGGPQKILNSEQSPLNSQQKLEKVLVYFKDNKMEVVVVDTTIPEVKKMGFTSVMVLAPKLHHMHLWEEYKCLGGKRLYEVPVKMGYLKKSKKEEELNKIPHPFP